MAKRETRDQAIERADHEGRRANLSSIALNAILSGEPVTKIRAAGDTKGHHYTYRLVRPTGAHGGIVIVTFHADGQSDHSAAIYLDEIVSEYRNAARLGIGCYTPAMHAAVQALVVARQAAWNSAV